MSVKENYHTKTTSVGITNLFIVSSPLQVLSAFEALNSLKLIECENIFVVYLGHNTYQNEQIISVIEFFKGIHSIRFRYLEFKNAQQFYISKIREIKFFKNKHVENLFVGHLSEYSVKLFICNVDFKKLIVLDDGAATIKQNDEFHSTVSIIKAHNLKFTSDKLKWLISKFYLLRGKKNVKINWFSMFSFTPLNGNNYFEHSFELLKNNMKKEEFKIQASTVYFIGSNLVNAKVLRDRDQYISMLYDIFLNIDESKSIIYLPHRFEDTSYLMDLFETFSVNIIRSNSIVELFFLESKVYPTEISSFYSTALFSLKKIYPKATIVFNEIDEKYVNAQFKETVKVVQNYYREFFI